MQLVSTTTPDTDPPMIRLPAVPIVYSDIFVLPFLTTAAPPRLSSLTTDKCVRHPLPAIHDSIIPWTSLDACAR